TLTCPTASSSPRNRPLQVSPRGVLVLGPEAGPLCRDVLGCLAGDLDAGRAATLASIEHLGKEDFRSFSLRRRVAAGNGLVQRVHRPSRPDDATTRLGGSRNVMCVTFPG